MKTSCWNILGLIFTKSDSCVWTYFYHQSEVMKHCNGAHVPCHNICSSCILNNSVKTKGVCLVYQRFYKRHSLEQHPFLLLRNSSHAQGRAYCWLIVAEVTSWFGWAWFVLQSKLENDLFLWLAQAYLENNVGVWKVLSWYENFDSFCFLFTWELLRVLGASHLLNWIVGQEIILTFSVLWESCDSVR